MDGKGDFHHFFSWENDLGILIQLTKTISDTLPKNCWKIFPFDPWAFNSLKVSAPTKHLDISNMVFCCCLLFIHSSKKDKRHLNGDPFWNTCFWSFLPSTEKTPDRKTPKPASPRIPSTRKTTPRKNKKSHQQKTLQQPPEEHCSFAHFCVFTFFQNTQCGKPRPSQISLLRVTLLIVDGLDGMEAQVKLCGLFWGMMSWYRLVNGDPYHELPWL